MTSKITLSGIMLAVICLFTSCLKSDNETVTYDDTAVTTFTLGTAICYRTVKSYDGLRDSTYSYRFSASKLPILIDQVNKRIYNEDSLPVGTDLSGILVTINTKNNGVVLFKNLKNDQWTYYASSDSVNLSAERTLRVVSSDGMNHADYKVNIVCHTEYADSFAWTRMPAQQTIGKFTKMKAVTADEKVFVLGNDAEGNVSLLATTDGKAWDECTLPAATTMAGASMACVNGKLTIYAGSDIYQSADGQQWNSITPDTPLKTIVGGCKGEMYAIATNGAILVSTDNGATWAQDAMESTVYVDNTKNIPAADITLLTSGSNTNSEIQSATMIGRKADTQTGVTMNSVVVWNKVVDNNNPQTWTYTNVADENKIYRLPSIKDVTVTDYADGIILLGDTVMDNTKASKPTMYFSPDHGATWHTQKGMATPQSVAGAACTAIVADGKGYFYVIATKPQATEADERCVIWKGKKNSVLWEKK